VRRQQKLRRRCARYLPRRLPDAGGPHRLSAHPALLGGGDGAGPAGTFETTETIGLSVSPDDRTILYGRGMAESDLMRIENFR
jgi:hypothetical protein